MGSMLAGPSLTSPIGPFMYLGRFINSLKLPQVFHRAQIWGHCCLTNLLMILEKALIQRSADDSKLCSKVINYEDFTDLKNDAEKIYKW